MPSPFDPVKRVAIVLPAFNEARHVADVVRDIPAWVDSVIVVDDGSTDGTGSAVTALSDPRVELIAHDRNRGLGAAMRTGYRAALAGGCDLVVKMDADGQMAPAELGRMLEPHALGLAEYTKGNRFYFHGRTRGMPGHRSFGNNVLSLLTKLASGYWHVYDSQCGYTVINREYLALLDLDALPDDYFFENAMLLHLNALGARVVDVPTSTIYGAEVSGVGIVRVALTFPSRLLVAGATRFWRKHLVTDFSPIGVLTLLGMFALVFGTAFGGFHWWLSVQTRQIASTGTVMIAVLPLAFAVQMLAQAFTMSVLSSPGAAETASYVRLLIARGEV